MLQQVFEAQGGVGWAPGGQDHVNRPATLEIAAVNPPLRGLHQELNSSQLAVKAGHVKRWQTLEDETQVMYSGMYAFSMAWLTGILKWSVGHHYFLHLCFLLWQATKVYMWKLSTFSNVLFKLLFKVLAMYFIISILWKCVLLIKYIFEGILTGQPFLWNRSYFTD